MKSLKISSKDIFILLLVLIVVKAIVYMAIKFDLFSFDLGGGNDSDYYDSYALGYEYEASSIWPILLYKLNSLGLYNRVVISFLLFFISVFFIPWLVILASKIECYDSKLMVIIFFMVNIYPSLFYYSLDIYRDVFMLFVFLIGVWFIRKFIVASNILVKVSLFLIIIAIGVFLIELRVYLGFSFLVSFLFYNIVSRVLKSLTTILPLIFFYLATIYVLNSYGFFELLINYREIFHTSSQGSTLGIDFSEPIMFIPNILLSIGAQLFGLYYPNFYSVIIFFLESLPFLFLFLFVLRNINYADGFIAYLLSFFIVYLTVWSIGNDNLGTALRLRFFNYLSIYICFFYLLAKKKRLMCVNNSGMVS